MTDDNFFAFFSKPAETKTYSETALVPAIVRDCSTWGVEKKTLKKFQKNRAQVGIDSMDTWSFDGYICALLANTIHNIETQYYDLDTADNWNAYQTSRTVETKHDTFEEELYAIGMTFSQYATDSFAYSALRDAEELNYALRSFLDLLPHLKHNGTNPYDYRGDIDILPKSFDKQEIVLHEQYRKSYGISEYDIFDCDTYITGLFALGFKILSEKTHSHPADLEEKQWRKMLAKLSGDFKAYHLSKTPLSEETKELFVERFPSFWD